MIVDEVGLEMKVTSDRGLLIKVDYLYIKKLYSNIIEKFLF